jgi:hypothetical protein
MLEILSEFFEDTQFWSLAIHTSRSNISWMFCGVLSNKRSHTSKHPKQHTSKIAYLKRHRPPHDEKFLHVSLDTWWIILAQIITKMEDTPSTFCEDSFKFQVQWHLKHSVFHLSTVLNQSYCTLLTYKHPQNLYYVTCKTLSLSV